MKSKEELKELMRSMTLEEKVCQLTSAIANFNFGNSGQEEPELENGIGEIAIMSVQPRTPGEIADYIKKIQDYVLTHSTHKIPVLFHCETLSGPHMIGGCLFPTSIGMGASFEPDLVKDMAERCQKQMLAVGIRQGLAPVVDVLRDLRWGRCGETYGGDPTLCGIMGTAFVKGLQGPDVREGVAATLKHFLGYSCSSGGLNMARIVTDYRDLRENFAKPYEMAIRDGKAKSIMNSYNEYEGIPICANREILTGLLREELGFTGVVVSDYGSIGRLVEIYGMTESLTEAGEWCLAAGLDLELPSRSGYNRQLMEDVKSGVFAESYIDTALERVLELKNELGLFDNAYPRFDLLEFTFDNTENNKKALEAAKKSITMTKNDGLLPITDRKKKIAVIGPMADAVRALYSAYTLQANVEMMIKGESGMAGVEISEEMAASYKKTNMDLHIADNIIRNLSPETKTIYEALAEVFSDITYVEGCDYAGNEKNDFEAARKAAVQADIVVMAVGGRNGFGATYCTSGEGVDSTFVGLPGNQEQLIREVFCVNTNIVVVHTDCRPIVSEWIYEHVPAILEAWLPCTFGGIAIAQTIAGINNPGGRLPLDVPRNSAHGPVAYYAYRGTESESFRKGAVNPQGYWDIDMSPRLPFGYGLSYTTFSYRDFALEREEDNICIKVTVENTGAFTGDEVVQLYGIDPIASVVRPAAVLLGFKRITLKQGQSKTVEFRFGLSIMAFYDTLGHWIVEAGEFYFYIGKSSKEKLYQQSVIKEKTCEIDYRERDFIAAATVYEVKSARKEMR